MATTLGRRTEERSRTIDEIAACNVAIGQCVAIANAYIAIKRQSTRPMCDAYMRLSQLVMQTDTGFARPEPIELRLLFDLQKLTPAGVSGDALNRNVSDRILSAFEPSALLPSLVQAIYNQHQITEARNGLLEKFGTITDDDEKIARYFGLRLASGHYDQSYPDLMLGLKIYTDDCLYFATLLSDVLSNHARQLAFQLGDAAPTVKRADFNIAQKNRLLPDPKNYADFEAQFRPKSLDMVVTM